jgi:hypothetical protein
MSKYLPLHYSLFSIPCSLFKCKNKHAREGSGMGVFGNLKIKHPLLRQAQHKYLSVFPSKGKLTKIFNILNYK